MLRPTIAVQTGSQSPVLSLSDRNNIIQRLYKNIFKQINFYITCNSGRDEDAEDIFHDALIVLMNKMDNGTLKLSCSIETFLFAICRNLWYHKLSHVNRMHEYRENHRKERIMAAMETESYDVHDELLRLMRFHFSRLDETSKKTLDQYLHKVPNKETTEMMGYKNKHYAKTRKFICKERLKNMIMKDPEYKKLELEMID